MRPAAADSVLRDPAFVRYLVARTASGAGTIITLIALPILVYRISDSASLTALVAALEAAPYFLFGLVSGALGDRWDRRRVMVTADIVSTLVLATLPAAHWLAEVTVPHVLAVAFVGPSVGVFFDGAVFGAIPTLVGRGRIGEANAISSALQGINEVLLPSVVGVLLAVVEPATLLVVDALTFAASAALLATITRPMHDADRERPPFSVRQLGRDIRVGLSYLVRHAGVRTLTIIGFVQCVAGGGFVALQVVWVDRQLDAGTEGWRFGVVFGAWAAGGIAASLGLPRLLRRVPAARITLLALPVSVVLGLVVPFAATWWQGALGLAAWSSAYTLVVVNAITYRQQVTPEELLSRVNTAGRMLSWGMGWTGGAFLAGALVGPLGLLPTLVTMSAVAVVGVVVAFTSPLRSIARADQEALTGVAYRPVDRQERRRSAET